MPAPQPVYPLDDSCSTLFNNTLYTYTTGAFQSLKIQKGALWEVLPMGVSVQGGVCVKSTPKNNTDAAALYIVGGMANTSDYQGLQRFTFASQQWETIMPQVPVTQNRLYHGAVYLNTSDSILVYAGTQDGTKQLSSQTFTIQASEPYNVLAFESIAPPAINPMLIPWTQSKALYVGGSATNTKAMIFAPSTSWVDSNSTLAEPFYNPPAVRSVVINGDDKSKTLYTFDMTVSPNAVNRTILVDGAGNPVQNAQAIVNKRDESLVERGVGNNLTVANWPTYNNSFVSWNTRTSYSVARDQSGLVVFAGGNRKDVICMFKARDNCWVNSTQVLAAKAVSQESPTTSAGGESTATGAILNNTAPAALAADSRPPFPVKILGAVLGSIVAAALFLILGLVLLRWRRKRRQHADAGHQRRSSGIPDEKNSLDFSDRGLPQMASTRQYPSHQQQDSAGSFSSMAILMGRVGHKRTERSHGSDASSQFNQKYKTAISKPIPQRQSTTAVAEASHDEKTHSLGQPREAASQVRRSTKGTRRGSTRRSSGWNRYWSGGSVLNSLGFGSRRSATGSDRSSDSSFSTHRPSQGSALPAPLNLGGKDRPELNRVVSGSPTIAHQPSDFPLKRAMSGTIERSGSVSSVSSYGGRHDAFSSGVPESVHEQSWNPVDSQDWAVGRAQSGYTESHYQSTLPRSTGNFTAFPYPPPQQRPNLQPPSDMSWLNLSGDSKI